MKEWNQGGTKLSEGQLFTFRDRQDSCLLSAVRLDIPEDQGKGKVGPRKVLFLQDSNFFHRLPSGDTFFALEGFVNQAI